VSYIERTNQNDADGILWSVSFLFGSKLYIYVFCFARPSVLCNSNNEKGPRQYCSADICTVGQSFTNQSSSSVSVFPKLRISNFLPYSSFVCVTFFLTCPQSRSDLLQNRNIPLFVSDIEPCTVETVAVITVPTELSRMIRVWGKFHNEICAFLGYYAASCGNRLPTFRDNVSVPSLRVKRQSGKALCLENRTAEYVASRFFRNVGIHLQN
jgi:hypothetical protein